jgi:mycoredoxin
MTLTAGRSTTSTGIRTVPVAVYGNRWCGISQMIRRALEHAGIEYAYVDLDEHPDAEWKLQRLAGGRLRTPVVYVDGEWLMEPSMAEVRSALYRHGALPWQ